MFDVGMLEIGLVGAVMLLILGPDRFIGLAKKAGQYYRAARKTWQKVVLETKQSCDLKDSKSDDEQHRDQHE